MKNNILLILFIITQINSSLASTYLFKAEKDDVSIEIFGTLHSLSLTALPDSIVDHIKNHDVLITENKQALFALTEDLAEKMEILRKDKEENYFFSLRVA